MTKLRYLLYTTDGLYIFFLFFFLKKDPCLQVADIKRSSMTYSIIFYLSIYYKQTVNNQLPCFICVVVPMSSRYLGIYWILAQVKSLVRTKRTKEASAKIEVWLD